MSKLKGGIPIKEAQKVANEVLSKISGKALICGSVRRELDYVGDVDIVAIYSADLVSELMRMGFIIKNAVAEVIMSRVPVSVYFAKEDNWGSTILHFTGSKELNIIMRSHAKRKGMMLNQYGLFRGGICIASKTEEEIFEKLGYTYLDPKDRSKTLKE